MIKTIFLITLTLIFFASNSILCRLALSNHLIDAFTFTIVRLASGAVALNIIVLMIEKGKYKFTGKTSSSISLLLYALLFSLAYIRLPASTGALILFGAVQITMIGWSIIRGLGPTKNEWIGLILSVIGLIYLLIPGIKTPDLLGALFMSIAGIGWGVYSIIGKRSKNPVSNTAGNFLLSSIISIPLILIIFKNHQISFSGFELAILSGAVSSGLGYTIWYTVLPTIKSTQAAIVQLLVPSIAAFLGAILLREDVSVRLIISGLVISLGVMITIMKPLKNPA